MFTCGAKKVHAACWVLLVTLTYGFTLSPVRAADDDDDVSLFDSPPPASDINKLAEIIGDFVGRSDTDWKGSRNVVKHKGALVINTTPENHAQVGRLLAALRGEAISAAKPTPTPPKALDKPISVNFVDAKAADAFEFIRQQVGLEWRIDWQLLEKYGIASDSPISLQLKDVPARQVIKLMFSQLDQHHGSANIQLVTTANGGVEFVGQEERPEERTYKVNDLVGGRRAAQRPSTKAPPELEAHRSVAKALQRPLTFAAGPLPLKEVVDAMRQASGLNINPIWDDLNNSEITADTPIQLKRGPTTVQKVLEQILTQFNTKAIAAAVVDGILTIGNSMDVVDQSILVNAYDIRDLLARGRSDPGQTVGRTTRAIERMARPNYWPNSGGENCQAVVFNNMLLVQAPVPYHFQVPEVLQKLRSGELTGDELDEE